MIKNALAREVLTQHERLSELKWESPEQIVDALDDATEAIMGTSTPELIDRTLDDSLEVASWGLLRVKRTAKSSVKRKIIMPYQGYGGGIITDVSDVTVFLVSFSRDGKRANNDQIQGASGEKPYPTMAMIKALRALGYENRPESLRKLSIEQWLASIGGKTLGCIAVRGRVFGASGCMPTPAMLSRLSDFPIIGDDLANETIEAYKGSGWADQEALKPGFAFKGNRLLPKRVLDVVERGGTLN